MSATTSQEQAHLDWAAEHADLIDDIEKRYLKYLQSPQRDDDLLAKVDAEMARWKRIIERRSGA